MYRLVQIYEEAKYDLIDLLRLHRIVKLTFAVGLTYAS